MAPVTFLGVTPLTMPTGKNTSSHKLVGFMTIFFANSPGSSTKRPTGSVIGSTKTFFAVATYLFPNTPSGAVPAFSAVALASYVSTVLPITVGAANIPATILTCGGTSGVMATYPAGLPTPALYASTLALFRPGVSCPSIKSPLSSNAEKLSPLASRALAALCEYSLPRLFALFTTSSFQFDNVFITLSLISLPVLSIHSILFLTPLATYSALFLTLSHNVGLGALPTSSPYSVVISSKALPFPAALPYWLVISSNAPIVYPFINKILTTIYNCRIRPHQVPPLFGRHSSLVLIVRSFAWILLLVLRLNMSVDV